MKNPKMKKKTHKLSKPIIILLPLISIIKRSFQMNLLTNLPEDVYISKLDKIGFQLSRFINGSQIKPETFPYPTITADTSDKFLRVNHDLENCNIDSGDRPHEIIALCEGPVFKTIHYLPGEEDRKIYELSDELDGFECKDLEGEEDYYFLSCVKENGVDDMLDLEIFVVSLNYQEIDIEKRKLGVLDSVGFKGFAERKWFDFHEVEISCHFSFNITVKCVTFFKPKEYKEIRNDDFQFQQNTFFVTFDQKSGLFVNHIGKKGLFSSEIERVRLVRHNWLYVQHSSEFYPCQLTDTDIICDKTKKFPYIDTKMSNWNSHFVLQSNRSIVTFFFFIQPEIVRRCSTSVIPLTADNIDCHAIDIQLNSKSQEDFILDKVSQTKNFDKFLISYKTKFQPDLHKTTPKSIKNYLKWYKLIPKKSQNPISSITPTKAYLLSGYLSVDMNLETTTYHNLLEDQADSIDFLNNSYYFLHRSKMVTLHKRSTKNGTKSAQLFI